jgi:hypothetical protein
LSFPVRADIVFPARLQLTETSPGTFEVVFILPVINGKILKAQPVLPEFCTPVSQPTVQVDAYQKKTRWEIRCENKSLHGQQIGIEGLLGSPIDIILEINTLQGRNYKTTLSPNESYYQIPPPPGLQEFLTAGTLTGARNLLLQWGLALMFLSFLLGVPSGRFGRMLLTTLIGVFLGYFLSGMELLLLPSWVGAISALLIGLILLLPGVLKIKTNRPEWPALTLMGLGGMLTGGGLSPDEVLTGFTPGEFVLLRAFGILGVSLGVVLLALLTRQFLLVLSLKWKKIELPLAKGLAALFLGILIWKLSLFWNYPSMLPSIPGAVLGFGLVLALWTAFTDGERRPAVALWVIPSLILGYLWGLWGILIPNNWAFLLATGAFFAILILFERSPAIYIQIALLFTAGLFAGNYLFIYADQSLSYPHARSVFFGILLALIAVLFSITLGWVQSPMDKKRYFRGTASSWLIFSLILGILLFYEIYPTTVGSAISEGRIPVPYLSILLLVSGLLIWPKRRKIHRKMGLARKSPVASLSLIAAALFCLPVFAEVQNPWHSLDQMDEKSLKGLMERRLWNTYTAFNIADEDALFEQLAENLDEELLDHIYLDSRRRLTMGLREGSRVIVKEVSLGALGSQETGSPGVDGWKYPATWTVTAQVKHLKHIHYRKNQYTGTIALKPMESGWKISEIVLTSEDRKVIASGSL